MHIQAVFMSDICYWQLYYSVGLAITNSKKLTKSDHLFLLCEY